MSGFGAFWLFSFIFSAVSGQFGFEESSKKNSFGSQILDLNQESNYISGNENSQLKTTWNQPPQSFNFHNTWNDPKSSGKRFQSWTSQNGNSQSSTSFGKPQFPIHPGPTQTLSPNDKKIPLYPQKISNTNSNSESSATLRYDNNNQRDQTPISIPNLLKKLNPCGKTKSNSCNFLEEQIDGSYEDDISNTPNFRLIKWQPLINQHDIKWTPNLNKRLYKRPTTASNPLTNSPSGNHSVLDLLDSNDWYFGRESNFPEIYPNSTPHIDVGQLWNWEKERRPAQSNRGSSAKGNTQHQSNTVTNNIQTTKTTPQRTNQHQKQHKTNIETTNAKRNNSQNTKNNHAKHGSKCQCVDVTLCREEDVLFTPIEQEDDTSMSQLSASFQQGDQSGRDFRRNPVPLISTLPGQTTCENLTDVCCTNPKSPPIAADFHLGKSSRPGCGETPLTGYGTEGNGFPWLLKLETFEGDLNCYASLIHPQMGLTAAHCVARIKPGNLYVKAGMSSYEESFLVRKVVKIIVHPNFGGDEPRNDVALLVFQLPFQTNEKLNVICLPVANEKWDLNRCLVSGWASAPLAGETFKEVAVEFPPQSQCQNIIMTDSSRPSSLHDSFLCAKQKNPSTSCLEAPGSPVICPSKNLRNGFLQIGLMSQSINCGYFGKPGLITNLLKFIDWINEVALDLDLL